MRAGAIITWCVSWLIILNAGLAVAGNGWNPPVKDPGEERRLRKVGAEFFRLTGQVYSLLAHIEENDMGRAKEVAALVRRQVGTSLEQCGELRKYIGSSGKSTVDLAYKNFVADFDRNTTRFVNTQVVPAGDPGWVSMSRIGSDNLLTLCEGAVEQVRKSFEPVASQIDRGSLPVRNDVWRVMNAVETASRQSRYFSIVVGGPGR